MLEIDIKKGCPGFTGWNVDREIYSIFPSSYRNPDIPILPVDECISGKARVCDHDIATLSARTSSSLHHTVWYFNPKTGDVSELSWNFAISDVAQPLLEVDKHWELMLAGELMSDLQNGVLIGLDRDLRRAWFKHYQRMILAGKGNRYVKEVPGTRTTLEIENGITAINNKRYTYKTQRPYLITANMIKTAGAFKDKLGVV